RPGLTQRQAAVGGAVVHQPNLQVLPGLGGHAVQAPLQIRGHVIYRYNDADQGPLHPQPSGFRGVSSQPVMGGSSQAPAGSSPPVIQSRAGQGRVMASGLSPALTAASTARSPSPRRKASTLP